MNRQCHDLQNSRTEETPLGRPSHRERVLIKRTGSLFLATVAMSLIGCGGGHNRVYDYEDHRYHETKSGGVLPVNPGGEVANATSVISMDQFPSMNSSENVSRVWNEGGKSE